MEKIGNLSSIVKFAIIMDLILTFEPFIVLSYSILFYYSNTLLIISLYMPYYQFYMTLYEKINRTYILLYFNLLFLKYTSIYYLNAISVILISLPLSETPYYTVHKYEAFPRTLPIYSRSVIL